MKRIARVGAMVLVVIAVFNLARTVRRLGNISGEIKGLRDEVTGLEKEKRELGARIRETEQPGFIEKEAREKLGLGREGEVIVVMPETKPTERQIEGAGRPGELPNWKMWAGVFGFLGQGEGGGL